MSPTSLEYFFPKVKDVRNKKKKIKIKKSVSDRKKKEKKKENIPSRMKTAEAST